jgi:hypothetical protein
MAIKLNVIDENPILFSSPGTSLQSHLLTAWSSHHFYISELVKRKKRMAGSL